MALAEIATCLLMAVVPVATVNAALEEPVATGTLSGIEVKVESSERAARAPFRGGIPTVDESSAGGRRCEELGHVGALAGTAHRGQRRQDRPPVGRLGQARVEDGDDASIGTRSSINAGFGRSS